MHRYLIVLAAGPDPTHSQMFAQTGHYATPREIMVAVVALFALFVLGVLKRANFL